MAFQLLDDVLDFIGQENKLGKPARGSDLQLGLATGPVLFAAQQVNLKTDFVHNLIVFAFLCFIHGYNI